MTAMEQDASKFGKFRKAAEGGCHGFAEKPFNGLCRRRQRDRIVHMWICWGQAGLRATAKRGIQWRSLGDSQSIGLSTSSHLGCKQGGLFRSRTPVRILIGFQPLAALLTSSASKTSPEAASQVTGWLSNRRLRDDRSRSLFRFTLSRAEGRILNTERSILRSPHVVWRLWLAAQPHVFTEVRSAGAKSAMDLAPDLHCP